ncbi:MAG: hypothetical protein M3N37_04230 [Actinomycetota bacterium]|nr:hypothetical protein [Actinomycetota bacterium]
MPAAALSRLSAPGQDEALAPLRLRYARGEISRDEYLQVAADLGAPVKGGDEGGTA